MKFEPWIILKLSLNFSDSELEHSYKLYSYEKGVCMHIGVTRVASLGGAKKGVARMIGARRVRRLGGNYGVH